MTQKDALNILKMGHNVYLTGAAGSGKTFLLNKYIRFLRDRGVCAGITASTGIASTHMNGRTIHSWAGIGIKENLTSKDIGLLLKKSKFRKRFEKTKVLIIDEVSMLHAHQLDMVDKVCKCFKGNNLPFGGLQVVLCGDFFQLPPVARQGASANFVNKSNIWQNMKIVVCYLSEQHRQGDEVFLRVLNNIRKDEVDEDDVGELTARMNVPVGNNMAITKLYTHNVDVDAINNFELKKISGKAKKYEMSHLGKKPLVEALKRSCLAPECLALKRGAVVMFVKNNFDKGYVNGTLGKVESFDEDNWPIVRTNAGAIVLAGPESWVIEENDNIEAQINQIPLRLAWAITVHKSQGMSLDFAQIDLKKAFEYGMGYVALSRVRTLQGIKLLGLNDVSLRVNPEVLEIDKRFKKLSDLAEERLGQISAEDIETKQKVYFEAIMPPEIDFEKGDSDYFGRQAEEKKIPSHHRTKELVLKKMALDEISKERELVGDTIIGHIERLLEEGEELDIDYLKPKDKDLEKIKSAFLKSEDGRLREVYEALNKKYSYRQIRLAQLFLR